MLIYYLLILYEFGKTPYTITNGAEFLLKEALNAFTLSNLYNNFLLFIDITGQFHCAFPNIQKL